MNDAYEMINDCMKRLREAGIPRIQKLQVEIVLLRIKRFLLALEGKVTNGDCHRELGMEKFHADFTRLCCSSDIEAATGCQVVVEEMADKLAAVVEAVGKK
jgi:hypothetical protein